MITGFDFCRIGGENYVTVEPEDSRRDETAERVLERERPAFLLELSVVEINDRVQLRYRMSGGVSLRNLQDGLSEKQFRTILKNLLQELQSCGDWFLDYHNFCLDPNIIFVDRDTMDVSLLYLPLAYEVMSEEEIQSFFQNMILGVRLSGNAGELQISLLQYLNGGSYSLSGLAKLVDQYEARYKTAPGASAAPAGTTQARTASAGAASMGTMPGPAMAGKTTPFGAVPVPPAPARTVVQPEPAQTIPLQPAQGTAGRDIKTGQTQAREPRGPLSADEKEDAWLDQLLDGKAEKPAKKEKHFSLFGGKKEKQPKPEKPPKKEKKETLSRRDKKRQKEMAAEEQSDAPVSYSRQPLSYEIPVSPADLDEGTDIGGSSSAEPHLELCSAAISSPPPFIPLHMGPAGMSIGRMNSKNIVSDYMFPAEIRGVSKQQARIFLEDGAYYLCDLNSSSGTFVNGERCIPNKAYRLKAGDMITFSEKYRLVYQLIL